VLRLYVIDYIYMMRFISIIIIIIIYLKWMKIYLAMMPG